MAKITKTITGFCYKDETVQELMNVAVFEGMDNVLFAKQGDAAEGRELKRMTMEFVIKDYKVKTPKQKKPKENKVLLSKSEPKTTASEGDVNNNADKS